MTDTRSEIWDCVVVGAGVIGSWTAYHLTQAGYNTLLIDQFALPHSRGSSHGQTRLVRKMYFEDHHVKITNECYDLWGKLAVEVKRPLMKQTGIVIIADKNSHLLKQTISAANKNPDISEVLNEASLKRRYPMLRLPPGVNGVIDNTGGLLPADTCMHALWEMIKKRGGTIQDSTQVTDVNPSTEPVSLSTNRGIIKARRIILAPGPWASDLLQKVGLNLPFKTMPGYGMYSRDLTGQHSVEANCPILYHYIKDDDEGYRFCAMFPSMEYPGLVKMISRGEPAPEYCHPDERDKCSRDEVARIIKDYVKTRLPGIEPDPGIIEPCIYTMTPDKDFVIDQHPRYKNVFVGAGGSGHAFMRAPVIGKLLCELVHGKETSYDRMPFRINRFSSSKL